MSFRPILLLALFLPLATCSRSSELPAKAVPPTVAATPAEPASAAPVAAGTEAVPGTGLLQSDDFMVIPGGQPYGAVKGKIEVVEFFNYICPACGAFDPMLQQWKAKLPPDVNVVYLPADFRDDFAVYARVYYAADLLGLVNRTHHAVYQAIHQDHTLPGEGAAPDPQQIAHFYAQYGVTAQAFIDAMESFAVNTRMSQGHQFELQSQISSTPSLVIGGKYLVKGHTFGDKLRIASQLIERERGVSRPAN